MTGLFITFEGPDGAGKTTQIQRLAEAIEAQGYQVMQTREPGGTRISDQIRSLLLNPEHVEMTDQAEVLLYAASRAQHVHQRMIPALQAGQIVLCDRFIDASIAYQAYGLGLSQEQVRAINAFASSGLQPDRTYMLDIPVEISIERLQQRTLSQGGSLDRIELKQIQYHQRVREGFLELARKDADRIQLIDAARPMDEITSEIIENCSYFLKQKYPL